MTGIVIRTKMADAMIKAFNECKLEGRNPGKVGHRILTNNASGVVGYKPLSKRTKKKENHKAESAVSMVAA